MRREAMPCLKKNRTLQKITIDGAIAQLGERLPCTQEVSGSIPLSSTMQFSDNTSERTGNGVLRSIMLFNNPEQAEN